MMWAGGWSEEACSRSAKTVHLSSPSTNLAWRITSTNRGDGLDSGQLV